MHTYATRKIKGFQRPLKYSTTRGRYCMHTCQLKNRLLSSLIENGKIILQNNVLKYVYLRKKGP